MTMTELIEQVFLVFSPFVTFYVWWRVMLWMIYSDKNDDVWILFNRYYRVIPKEAKDK